jgi:hypothetical protein
MKNFIQSYSNFTRNKSKSINESYREIDEEEFDKLIDTSYTFLNSDFKPDFYRGMNNTEKLILINTDDHIRYSKGTEKMNVYNYWIDNHEDWKEYPKRSKAIICANNRSVAKYYGNMYKILPLQKPELFKMGVCPVSDIWNSFEKGSDAAFKKMMVVSILIIILILNFLN